MDSDTSDVGPAAVEGVEFLPARERWDPTSFAVASFLARYRDLTLRAYRQDMLAFLRWCAERHLAPLEAQRPHLELYLRWMESQGLAPATIGRRFGTVAGFYKYAVLDSHVPTDPTLAVTRPRIAWEGQRRTVLHPPGVRGAADSCPARRTAVPRPGSASGDARPAGQRGVQRRRHRSALRQWLRAVDDHGQGPQASLDPAAGPGPTRGPRRHRRAEGRPDPAQPRSSPADTRRRGRAAAPTGRRNRARSPDQSSQPAPDLLHRRADLRRPAA